MQRSFFVFVLDVNEKMFATLMIQQYVKTERLKALTVSSQEVSS